MEGCCKEVHHHDYINKLNDDYKNFKHFDKMGDLFKVFGDPTRLRIMFILFEREVCVCDIAAIIGMQQSAISHQLKTLKQANLVKSRREGKSIYYSLSDDHVKNIFSMSIEHIEE